jgi:hypothetical protein
LPCVRGVVVAANIFTTIFIFTAAADVAFTVVVPTVSAAVAVHHHLTNVTPLVLSLDNLIIRCFASPSETIHCASTWTPSLTGANGAAVKDLLLAGIHEMDPTNDDHFLDSVSSSLIPLTPLTLRAYPSRRRMVAVVPL